MNYETHDFLQGSPEWHAHRAKCYNASDLAAAAGESPYKSRDKLIRELATGEEDVIDPATQRRFDDGHRFEDLARPLAEAKIGESLFASVISASVPELSRRLGVSLDGNTMADETNWEHKTLSESLAASLDKGVIPDFYHYQMEQGMMVNGATRCLFTASKWDSNDKLLDIKHVWYESNPELRAKIIPIWKRLEEDVAAYKPAEVIPAAVAAPISDLPALAVQISGNVLASNLDEWREIVAHRIESINTDLKTDQDFADADSMTKFLAEGEKSIGLVKKAAQAQAEPIDTLFRALDDICETMRQKRLELEKLVKARKDAIRNEILAEGQKSLAEHIATLNKRLVRVIMPSVAADFAGAMKGKKTADSLRNAVSTTLANAKIAADEIAGRIETNLATLDQNADHAFLFNDLPALALKANEDLQNVIKIRISEHEAEQTRRRETAERTAAEQKPIEVVAVAQPAHEQAKQAAQPTMTPVHAPDLAKDIIGMIAGMDDAELKLVAHYCERVIAQRKEAA